jgi:hypothetical protein
MDDETMKALKVGRRTGALVGGILFAVFGIVPAFYFGSYAAIVLLSSLTGGPVEPGIIARVLVVAGVLLGLFCTAAVSIVAGSVVGTALAYVAGAASGALGRKPRIKETVSSISAQ